LESIYSGNLGVDFRGGGYYAAAFIDTGCVSA